MEIAAMWKPRKAAPAPRPSFPRFPQRLENPHPHPLPRVYHKFPQPPTTAREERGWEGKQRHLRGAAGRFPSTAILSCPLLVPPVLTEPP